MSIGTPCCPSCGAPFPASVTEAIAKLEQTVALVAGVLGRRRGPEPTVRSVYDAWANTLSREAGCGLSKAQSVWRSHFERFGDLRVSELVAARLIEWERWARVDADYASKSIKDAFEHMARAMRRALELGHIERLPWGSWKPPRAVTRKPREAARSLDEALTIVRLAFERDAVARKHGEFADLGRRVLVMLLCGLRQGEAVALGWDCVALDASPPTLTVRYNALEQWQRHHPTWTRPMSPPKGRKSRTIVLHEAAVAALRAQRDALDACGGYSATGPVFPMRHGHGWRTHNACIKPEAFKELVIKAGLPNPDGWCVHSLRHSFATLEHGHGADLRTVQARTGHASLEVLEGYIHRASGRNLPRSSIPSDALLAAIPSTGAPALEHASREVEIERVRNAIAASDGTAADVARRLGVAGASLARKLDRLGLPRLVPALRTCEGCGREYAPGNRSNAGARFCEPKCRKQWLRRARGRAASAVDRRASG